MEEGKTVQGSGKKIASGFIMLVDKLGVKHVHTVSMNNDKRVVRDQDLPFHPDKALQQEEFAKSMIPCGEKSFMFDRYIGLAPKDEFIVAQQFAKERNFMK